MKGEEGKRNAIRLDWQNTKTESSSNRFITEETEAHRLTDLPKDTANRLAREVSEKLSDMWEHYETFL